MATPDVLGTPGDQTPGRRGPASARATVGGMDNLRDLVPVAVSIALLLGVAVAAGLGLLELAELGLYLVQQ